MYAECVSDMGYVGIVYIVVGGLWGIMIGYIFVSF